MAQEMKLAISSAFGAVFVIIISLSYVFGYCLLSRSLWLKSRDQSFACFNRSNTLILGICTVLLANGLYMVVLNFASVSILASAFSVTLISVIAGSIYFLDNTISSLAFVGYGILLAGVVVLAILFREPIYQCPDSNLLSMVKDNTYGIIYLGVLLSMLVGGSCFAYWFETPSVLKSNSGQNSPNHMQTLADLIVSDFEQSDEEGGMYHSDRDDIIHTRDFDTTSLPEQRKTHFQSNRQSLSQSPYIQQMLASMPDQQGEPSSNFPESFVHDDSKAATLVIAQITYPTCLGMVKAIFLLFNQYPNLALNILYNIAVTFGMIVFLVLAYSRFTISEVFPIEFGVLTFVFVLGGLLCSEESTLQDSEIWIYLCAGGVVFFCGVLLIAIITRRKSLNDRMNSIAKIDSSRSSLMFPPRDEVGDPSSQDEDDDDEDNFFHDMTRLEKQSAIKSSSDPLTSILWKVPPKATEEALYDKKYIRNDSPQIPSPLYSFDD